jgi:hypothetical protein
MSMTSDPALLLTRTEAAALLRVSLNTFDRRVGSVLPKVLIGRRVLFRRVDIESWINNTPGCYKRPALYSQGDRTWDKKVPSKDSFYGTGFGTSKNKSKGSEFEKALAQLTNEKRKNS